MLLILNYILETKLRNFKIYNKTIRQNSKINKDIIKEQYIILQNQ